MTMYKSRVFYEIVKYLFFFFNCSAMASVMCHSSHGAVGKYLCKFHNNKFMFERSYLMRNFDNLLTTFRM